MALYAATLVGCNYAGTENQLGGCINDVHDMRAILNKRFPFQERNIIVLTDVDDNPALLPTGANIKAALVQMVDWARGAVVNGERAMLFFHFSGHGTLLQGRHEAIVPCDFNLITDVDFRQLVNQLPQGATFTMASDSCHSGGLIGQAKEQTTFVNRAGAGNAGRHRLLLPYETVLRRLDAPAPHDLRQLKGHMFQRFGNDASALFLHVREPAVLVPRPDSGILLSGCQWNETSAEGPTNGAFTDALLTSLGRAQNLPTMTNWDVVARARRLLLELGYTQHSCLFCSDDNARAPFLRIRQD